MIKHVFFDLDNTLTPSRSLLSGEHLVLLEKLCHERDVVVVSGAEVSQILIQIKLNAATPFYILSQTGNHALGKDHDLLWREMFNDAQTEATNAFIEQLKKQLALNVNDPDDLVEYRGSQISYSPIGHHEDLEKKYAFDPSQEMRRRTISQHASEVSKLKSLGVDVVPGGTTCFDFFLAGKNKGFNVARLVEQESWNKDECVYVGDALFPGGNDETVIGVIATHAVKDPDETFEYVRSLLTEK